MEIIINNNSSNNSSSNNSSNNDKFNNSFENIKIIENEYYLYNELMEPWAYTTVGIFMILVGICGFTFNLFVIVLMLKDFRLWTPVNIILFNLICADFLVSIFGCPIVIIAAMHRRWIFGETICIAYGFFMALLGITSITTLTVLSYERYYLIKYPFKSKQLTKCSSIIVIICIWIYSLSLTMPPLFDWGAYVNEAANISCSINWETQSYNTATYILFLFTFGLILPVSIIFFSYINIIVIMKNNANRLGRTRGRAEVHVAYMVGIMILAFLIAWSPYAIFSLIQQFSNTNWIGSAMSVLPSLLAKSSICYNPIIYVGMNSQYRQALNRLRGKNSNTGNTIIKQNTQTSELLTDDREKRKKMILLCKLMKDQKEDVNVINNNMDNYIKLDNLNININDHKILTKSKSYHKDIDKNYDLTKTFNNVLRKSHSYESNFN